MFEISITEETIKILIVALGLFIAREDSTWTDTKLTLALIAGLVFGIAEGFGYIFNGSYSHLGEIVLFLSRMFHPVLTVTLMAGLILLVKGRKLPGVLIAVSPYFTHAFIDYSLSIENYIGVSVVFIASFVMFLAGIYLLLPVIDEEKNTRAKFQREATVNIEDHWLKKLN